jgi:flagellar hook assembly protein FlgD
MQVRPNPFNPKTEIQFVIPPGCKRIELSVYDVRGKLVRTLINGKSESGENCIYWNGRDDHGQACASGVYFCRLIAGPHTAMKRMVLIR